MHALTTLAAEDTDKKNVVDLLTAAKTSLEWQAHYSSVTNVRYRAIFGEGTRQSHIGTDSVVKKARDEDRLHIIIEFVGHLTPGGEFIRRASRRESLFGQNGRTGWWYPIDKPLTGSVQVARSAERTNSMRLVDECDPGTGAFLDGNIDGMGNIIDLASSGTVSPSVRDEAVGGVDCKVVESRTISRAITLWIAPSKGDAIVKYMLDQGDGPMSPMHAEFEATRYQDVDDRPMIRGGRESRSWTDSNDHTKWTETVDADRGELNLHPDFKAANLFTTHDIPDGIRVFIDDLPNVGVDFIWSHGGPVAKVDSDLFDQLGASVHRTMAGEVSKTVPTLASMEPAGDVSDSGGRVSQVWVVLFSAIAIAATLLIFIFMERRNPRAIK